MFARMLLASFWDVWFFLCWMLSSSCCGLFLKNPKFLFLLSRETFVQRDNHGSGTTLFANVGLHELKQNGFSPNLLLISSQCILVKFFSNVFLPNLDISTAFPKIGKLPFIALMDFQFFHSEYFVTYKFSLWQFSGQFLWFEDSEDFEDIWKMSFVLFVLSFERFGRYCLLCLLCLLSSTGNFTLSSYASKGFRIRNVSISNCFQEI